MNEGPATREAAPQVIPSPAAGDAHCYTYDQPWHASINRCVAHGCRLRHVSLQDFVPGAQSSDRNKLRDAVRRWEINGTKNVPKQGQSGNNTMRDTWWWHEGDPELEIARGKFPRPSQ